MRICIDVHYHVHHFPTSWRQVLKFWFALPWQVALAAGVSIDLHGRRDGRDVKIEDLKFEGGTRETLLDGVKQGVCRKMDMSCSLPTAIVSNAPSVAGGYSWECIVHRFVLYCRFLLPKQRRQSKHTESFRRCQDVFHTSAE